MRSFVFIEDGESWGHKILVSRVESLLEQRSLRQLPLILGETRIGSRLCCQAVAVNHRVEAVDVDRGARARCQHAVSRARFLAAARSEKRDQNSTNARAATQGNSKPYGSSTTM
jgi:hypothetical protein